MKNRKKNDSEMQATKETKQNKVNNCTKKKSYNYAENFDKEIAEYLKCPRRGYKSIEDTFFTDEKGVFLHNSKYWDIAAAIYMYKVSQEKEMIYPKKLFRAINNAGFHVFKRSLKNRLTDYGKTQITDLELRKIWNKMTYKEMVNFLDDAVYYPMHIGMKYHPEPRELNDRSKYYRIEVMPFKEEIEAEMRKANRTAEAKVKEYHLDLDN